jgi:hypothetical protein
VLVIVTACFQLTVCSVHIQTSHKHHCVFLPTVYVVFLMHPAGLPAFMPLASLAAM